MRTFVGPTASIVSIAPAWEARLPPAFRKYFMDATTASAVRSVPSVNLTPWRRVSSKVLLPSPT
jgi:hypothetical protein